MRCSPGRGRERTPGKGSSPLTVYALRWEDYRRLTWVEAFPFTTLWAELLFNIRPTFTPVKEALNVMALINALLLTVVMAIPVGVPRADLDAANQLFVDPSFNPSVWFTRVIQPQYGLLSNAIADNYTLAACTLAASLVSIILMYMFGSVTELEEDDLFLIWWWFTRWLFLAQIALTVAGIAYAFGAFFYLELMKFDGLDEGTICYRMVNGKLETTWDKYCAAPYNYSMQASFLYSVGLVTLFVLCLANVPRTAARKRLALQKAAAASGPAALAAGSAPAPLAEQERRAA